MGDAAELAARYRDEGADELVFYDITASPEGRTLDYAWVKSIARGDRTLEDAKTWIRDQAELAFPAYSAQIKAGMNVSDIAAGYTQTMSDLLEVQPEAIKLDDKMIRRALTNKNKDGKPEALSQTDFELIVRQDARWRGTKNAQDEVFSIASKVLKDFGFQA